MNTSSWGPHPAARALLTVQLCSLYSALAYCLFYRNMSHSSNPGAKPLSDVRHAPRLLEGAIIARSRQPPPPLPPPSPLGAFPRLPSSVFPFYVVTDWMTGDGCCCGWRSVVAPTADPPTLLLALCPVTRPLSLLFLVRPLFIPRTAKSGTEHYTATEQAEGAQSGAPISLSCQKKAAMIFPH